MTLASPSQNEPFDKQLLIQAIRQAFYSEEYAKYLQKVQYKHLHKSEIFLIFLKENETEIFSSLTKTKTEAEAIGQIVNDITAVPKDDRYGILTLRLASTPFDLEFRLKEDNAYGGPKVEDYIDRLNLRIEAIETWLKNNHQYTPEKSKELAYLKDFFTENILQKCDLDPEILGNLQRADQHATRHFEEQHTKAKNYLAAFMQICDASFSVSRKKLYHTEQELMSKKRPLRVSIHKVKLSNLKGIDEIIEVNTTTPVNPDKTISSTKKDSTGVANWLSTRTEMYSTEGELLATDQIDRSASIVPHELFSKYYQFKDSDGFNQQLAYDTAKRNVSEHIIPHLLEKTLLEKGDLAEPIELEYELLTLLSPRHFIGQVMDPDKAQFKAIRDAINFYAGREFPVKIKVNGQDVIKVVKFNAIYHNYGANFGRGGPIEKPTQRKAYNQIIDRSLINIVSSLQKAFDKNVFPKNSNTLQKIIYGIPNYTVKERETLLQYQENLNNLYQKIENVYKKYGFSQPEHEKLMRLHAKFMKKEILTGKEVVAYHALTNRFKEVQKKALPLRKQARHLEENSQDLHATLANRRQSYLKANEKSLDSILKNIENTKVFKDTNEFNQFMNCINHTRALLEFTKAFRAPYDLFGIKNNYEIQSYIEMLNNYNKGNFHLTCKSGKDRSNASDRKNKVKMLLKIWLQRVPRLIEKSSIYRKAKELFGQGILLGPGNDICADNIKPGMQLSANLDVNTNTSLLKKMGGLQKGINNLKSNRQSNDIVAAYQAWQNIGEKTQEGRPKLVGWISKKKRQGRQKATVQRSKQTQQETLKKTKE